MFTRLFNSTHFHSTACQQYLLFVFSTTELQIFTMADHTHAHTHEHEHAHGHGHTHGHGHGHGHDFVAANKEYFDANATKLEELYPGWRALARKQVDQFRKAWPELFDPERTEVLDFACGIG